MSRLTTFFGVFLLVAGALLLLTQELSAVAPAPAPSAPAPSAPAPSAFAPSRVPSGTPFPTATAGVRAIPDGYRVQLPRLRIDLPIAEGDIKRDTDEQKTPEDYAFHLPGTAIPGEVGNSYLYAHARSGMFLSLWNAREGDEVFVSTPDGRALKYVVVEVRPRVPFREVSVAAPTQREQLTLQTSTGPNPEDPRFVVIATPRV